MLEWLWWLGKGLVWMWLGAFALAAMLLWLHWGEEQEAKAWRVDEEGRPWKNR